jgi:hypothetical protein
MAASATVEKPENKVERSGVFFEAEKCPSTHHVYHAFHHDGTIKKATFCTPFFSKTPAKTPIRHRKKNSAKTAEAGIAPGLCCEVSLN